MTLIHSDGRMGRRACEGARGRGGGRDKREKEGRVEGLTHVHYKDSFTPKTNKKPKIKKCPAESLKVVKTAPFFGSIVAEVRFLVQSENCEFLFIFFFFFCGAFIT